MAISDQLLMTPVDLPTPAPYDDGALKSIVANDGTITIEVNGNRTINATWYIFENLVLPAGEYSLSGLQSVTITDDKRQMWSHYITIFNNSDYSPIVEWNLPRDPEEPITTKKFTLNEETKIGLAYSYGSANIGETSKVITVIKPELMTTDTSSISGKLCIIANNTPAVCEKIDSAITKVSGTSLTITDVNPVEHSVACKLKSKNLLNAMEIASQNNNTDYVKDTENNSFTMRGNEGTAAHLYNTGQLMFPYTNTATISQRGIPVKAGKTYTLSFDYLLLEQGKYNNYIRGIVNWSNLDVVTSYGFKGAIGETQRYSLKFTASKDDMVGVVFRINNNYVTISNIQVEEGSTATAYAPYIADISTVKVQRFGKNLFNGELTIWRNADRIMPKKCIRVKRNTWYRITAYDYTIENPSFACFGNNTGVIADGTDKSIISNNYWNYYTSDYDYIWFRQWNTMTGAGITTNCRVQIEEVNSGSSPATDFEPYIEPVDYSANADGTVEGVTSLYPTTTLIPDNNGVTINAKYFSEENSDMYSKYAALNDALQKASDII